MTSRSLAIRVATLAVLVLAPGAWPASVTHADPPEAMAREMARLARRAHSVVWLNPRAGADGFSPDVGGMAAALPFVDRLLPAGSFTDLRAAVTAVAETGALSSRSSGGSRAGTARR